MAFVASSVAQSAAASLKAVRCHCTSLSSTKWRAMLQLFGTGSKDTVSAAMALRKIERASESVWWHGW
jgi:hypothetical protein